MYCGWRPIQRVFRLKRRKRALIGREQTTGSAGGSDYVFLALYSEGEQPFCLWNNRLKYSGLLYPTMPAISFIE